MGHLKLVNELSTLYSPLFERQLNPLSNFVVTSGATEASFATIQALVNPGDEVVIMEPYFDMYPAQVVMAGGVPRFVPFHFRPRNIAKPTAADWKMDLKELEQSFSDRTRLLFLNTPHNPLGKMFTVDELRGLSDLLLRFPRILVVSDEVYEFVVFGEERHVRLASLPGMFDRTITLGSAGKSFSVTGWKVGWTIANGL